MSCGVGRMQMWLRSQVAVVVKASIYSSDLTPSLQYAAEVTLKSKTKKKKAKKPKKQKTTANKQQQKTGNWLHRGNKVQ